MISHSTRNRHETHTERAQGRHRLDWWPRRQGFFGAAMLPMNELEYTGIVERLDELRDRFVIRDGVAKGRRATSESGL